MTGEAAIERFAAMGTRVELHLFGSPDNAARDALVAARRAVMAVDDSLTIHRPSPTIALNEALRSGEVAIVGDPILFDALVASDEAHRDTFGLFDIAADTRSGSDWSQVAIDRERRTVAASQPLALDFGGIGKGIALDRAAAVLRVAGVAHALLSAGESSIAVIGEHPLGGAWPFAIPHPLPPERELVTIELAADEALSISATIGAGTAAPERAALVRPGAGADAGTVPDSSTAIAIAATATAAEALSTALLVADHHRAERLLAAAPTHRYRFDHDDTMSKQIIGMLV